MKGAGKKALVNLRGEHADAYVAMLRRLIAVARPGAQFSPARRLDVHVGFLGPAGSNGVYDAVDVDPASGLPSLRELLRIRADHEIAADFLAHHAKMLPAKAEYYRRVGAADVLEASQLAVRLRGRDGRQARFEVVHDRIDAALGCFVRFTIQLEQTGGKRHVALARGDLSEPTARFRTVVERYSGADAELALLLLADLPDVRVTEVIRGQIGPLHFAGIPAPPLLERALADLPGAFILHLAVERAGTDVADHRSHDPFATPHRDTLTPDARAAIEQRREQLGYRVARERRLICTPAAERRLQSVVSAEGHRIVIRS